MILRFFSLLVYLIHQSQAESSFKIDTVHHQFLLDGTPFTYLAGEIHYFRIPTNKWEDRLKRVRAMGFNAITVPVPWNLHQLNRGSVPNFSDNLDLVKFIRIAEQNGLFTLIRLGPFMADEWENGGLPWWLIKNSDIKKYRSSDTAFMSEVTQWWSYLLPKIEPLLRKNGGPILMAQIEHYYGLTGICDQLYILDLANLAKKYLGNDTVLYSVDMPMLPFLQCGIVPGMLPTIEIQPNSDTNAVNRGFQQQQMLAGGGPNVGSQFLLGNYKLWGKAVNDSYSQDIILKTLQAGWNLNVSMSFHMSHGGTNFGFWNGNNSPYPVTTSYDFYAPISEGGDTTELFIAIRNFISKLPNWANPPTSIPAMLPRTSYNPVAVKPVDSITGFITRSNPKCWQSEDQPMTAEDIDQGYGFVYYRTEIPTCGVLNISKYADDAYVYLNGQFVGALYAKMADIHNSTMNLSNCKPGTNTLEIIVENTGRSHTMYPSISKGIQGLVFLDSNVLQFWKTCQTPFGTIGLNTVANYEAIIKQIQSVQTVSNMNQPAIFTGTLDLASDPMDTYIDARGWGKGFITVNNFNIGRYWSTEGPQQTLFLPSDFLQKGTNTIIIYEFEGAGQACFQSSCYLKFIKYPIFSF